VDSTRGGNLSRHSIVNNGLLNNNKDDVKKTAPSHLVGHSLELTSGQQHQQQQQQLSQQQAQSQQQHHSLQAHHHFGGFAGHPHDSLDSLDGQR